MTSTRKVVWTKNAPKRDLASNRQADFTGVTPASGTGTSIIENSKIYSRYVPGTVKLPAWRQRKFNESTAPTETTQSTS